MVTDGTGKVVSSMQYRPYGDVAYRSGVAPVYGFAGGEIEEEEELGLIRFGARWYAPDVGRWVSGDWSFVEDANKCQNKILENNLYSYASNNPTSAVDDKGDTAVILGAFVGGVIGAGIEFVSQRTENKEIPLDWHKIGVAFVGGAIVGASATLGVVAGPFGEVAAAAGGSGLAGITERALDMDEKTDPFDKLNIAKDIGIGAVAGVVSSAARKVVSKAVVNRNFKVDLRQAKDKLVSIEKRGSRSPNRIAAQAEKVRKLESEAQEIPALAARVGRTATKVAAREIGNTIKDQVIEKDQDKDLSRETEEWEFKQETTQK